MSDIEEYDSIGVTITQDHRGKFSAQRVFIKDDCVLAREELTDGRAISWALKEALDNLGRLAGDWNRQLVEFARPSIKQLKVEEHSKK